MTRVHNVDRAQLLIESASRPALQAFLKEWLIALRDMKSRVKWSLEVAPLDIKIFPQNPGQTTVASDI